MRVFVCRQKRMSTNNIDEKSHVPEYGHNSRPFAVVEKYFSDSEHHQCERAHLRRTRVNWTIKNQNINQSDSKSHLVMIEKYNWTIHY